MKRLACLAVLLLSSSAFAQDYPIEKSPRLDRLERVARAIKDVPPQRFDMSTYGRIRQQPEPGSEEFYGCALGHAIQNDLAFSREGLRIRWEGVGSSAMVTYGRLDGTYAVMTYFGITFEEASRLFGNEPRTPDYEVGMIRGFIAAHRPRPTTNIAALVGGGFAVALQP